MDRIRLGVVGSGSMATRRMERFAQQSDCQLVALAARNRQTGRELAQRFAADLHDDWRALVERSDLDAILVFTHNELHGAISTAALDSGKHVFSEYPLARHLDEGSALLAKAQQGNLVLRLAHNEPVSAEHQQLKRETEMLGPLYLATFTRLTPSRGARPDVLFNLQLSGPPTLFFIYHVYPYVDLFGPACWVESSAEYVGLQENGRYERFVNTLQVAFEKGGLGQWTWAGGIATSEAEEFERLVLRGGTLLYRGGAYHRSTPDGIAQIDFPSEQTHSLESLFLAEVRGESDGWRADLRVAFDAMHIGLAAEQSARDGCRIRLD